MPYQKENIRELAELIDCGNICFLHKNTEQIEYYPREIDLFLDEENPWQPTINEVEKNSEDYISIKPMDSRQSFQVMELFTKEIKSANLRNELQDYLNRPKPFRNFRFAVENSSYRQEWFDFKLQQNILWVEEQISEDQAKA